MAAITRRLIIQNGEDYSWDTDFRTDKGAFFIAFGKGGRMLEESSVANKDSGVELKSVRQTELIGTEPCH
jgi:hypothetical protein